MPISDYPTKCEIQVLQIIHESGSIRDYKIFDKLNPRKKGHFIAPLHLDSRGFITSDNGSKGSITYTILPAGIAYLELHKARKTIDESMQRILRQSRENYSDWLKDAIKRAKAYRESGIIPFQEEN